MLAGETCGISPAEETEVWHREYWSVVFRKHEKGRYRNEEKQCSSSYANLKLNMS
mgnify:CR=1 FL=1